MMLAVTRQQQQASGSVVWEARLTARLDSGTSQPSHQLGTTAGSGLRKQRVSEVPGCKQLLMEDSDDLLRLVSFLFIMLLHLLILINRHVGLSRKLQN